MPSIERPLAGDVLIFDLDAERERAGAAAGPTRRGPSGRTLLKDGPLRVTMIVLAAGGEIAEHQAEGPITVHVIEGALRFTALGTPHELSAGNLLAAGAGVRHALSSEHGATFLLTVALPQAAPDDS